MLKLANESRSSMRNRNNNQVARWKSNARGRRIDALSVVHTVRYTIYRTVCTFVQPYADGIYLQIYTRRERSPVCRHDNSTSIFHPQCTYCWCRLASPLPLPTTRPLGLLARAQRNATQRNTYSNGARTNSSISFVVRNFLFQMKISFLFMRTSRSELEFYAVLYSSALVHT